MIRNLSRLIPFASLFVLGQLIAVHTFFWLYEIADSNHPFDFGWRPTTSELKGGAATATTFHVFQIAKPHTGSTLLNCILQGLLDEPLAKYNFIPSRQPKTLLDYNGERFGPWPRGVTQKYIDHLGADGKNNPFIFHDGRLKLAQESLGVTTVTKAHLVNVDELEREFGHLFDVTLYVAANHAERNLSVDGRFCDYETVLCVDYADFAYRPEESTDEDITAIVRRVKSALMEKFPLLGHLDIKMDVQQAVARMRMMEGVTEKMATRPFEEHEPFFGIHGGHWLYELAGKAKLIPFNRSAAAELSSFDPWIKQYISFHRDSIQDGKLKDGVPYLIYRCKDGETKCGGAGDRMIGMVKMFYIAMCTNRVLFIDSPFPIPHSKALNPAHIQWNASFPETTISFNDTNMGSRLQLRQEVLGYFIPRTNGPPTKMTVGHVIKSRCMKNHFERNGWQSEFESFSFASASHQAFWALFQFDDAVLSRAAELKASAKIMDQYVGLHLRTGDHKGLVDGSSVAQGSSFAEKRITSCYKKIQSVHNLTSAYLASDNGYSKKRMQSKERSITFPQDFRAFHIDLATRNHTESRSKHKEDGNVYQGMIDTWHLVSLCA